MSATQQRLIEQLRQKGWAEVRPIPDRYTRRPNSYEVEAQSPEGEFEIYLDADHQGNPEGFEISRTDPDAPGPLTSGRLPTRTVPTPEEAVGAWEDARARAVGA